jgi:hypothetical protein
MEIRLGAVGAISYGERETVELNETTRSTEIRSPVQGHVLRVYEEHDRVVSAGTPLLEVGDLCARTHLDILSTDAVRVQAGATVHVEHWGECKPCWRASDA